MNQKKLALSVLLLSLMQAGCATYKSPENSNTRVTFKMADGINANSNQFYYIYPQPECNEAEGYGQAASMMKMWGLGGLDTTVDVLAGERIYILSEIKNHSGGTTVYTRSCRNFMSFTPENNQHYSIQQLNRCAGVSVRNQNQLKEVVSIDSLEIPTTCKFGAK